MSSTASEKMAKDISSGTLARILQLLAFAPGIQDRLRAELQEAPEMLSYDESNALPYLDAVCRETLRLYPAVPFIEREALKDWVVPLRYSLKGKDGNTITEIKVRKGTKVYVSLREANRCKWVIFPNQRLSLHAHVLLKY